MVQKTSYYLTKYDLQDLFPKELQQVMQVRTFAPGKKLLLQGETATAMLLLVEGKVKVSMLSPEGKRLIVAFKTPFDIVGDVEYVTHGPLINTVESVMETTVIEIPYTVLRNGMAQNAAWLQFLLEAITKKFELKSHTMNFNLLYPVDVRVASYLLSMTPVKEKIESASLVDMADLIGTSYRHLNRVLSQFQKAGWISKSRGSIEILNRASIMELAGENIYEKGDVQ
ncbi:Crp/Fnr family transcriptional regulator [Jeotgalibacillus aurantiacus]|uniref:Crp/Fnr family transcriptional regulator n=1 Tax=Jeotgalibacillus aurantiacus TaxID=2763266 RepID=UPI001D0BB2D6|nr:Crp/Fnr family transcriptional regulator [Jeotgalibacillus aurantiacus]